MTLDNTIEHAGSGSVLQGNKPPDDEEASKDPNALPGTKPNWYKRLLLIIGRTLLLLVGLLLQAILVIYLEIYVTTKILPGFDVLSDNVFDFLNVAFSAAVMLPVAMLFDVVVLTKRLTPLTKLGVLAAFTVLWTLGSTWILASVPLFQRP